MLAAISLQQSDFSSQILLTAKDRLSSSSLDFLSLQFIVCSLLLHFASDLKTFCFGFEI